MRSIFFLLAFVLIAAVGVLGYFWTPGFFLYAILAIPLGMGFADAFQRSQTIKRNFPFIGRFRYWFEAIRPEINQYFVESNTDGMPFSRETRSLVYQRAKGVRDTLPFGTQRDVYLAGYEWLNHSLQPTHPDFKSLRVQVGGPQCKQPYNASFLNISAMSYGSLSRQAVLALNGGAKDGGFFHNTGEGGVSPHHLENGGDLCWQIGTGYFGCRNNDGTFNADMFAERVQSPSIKMIEIKLSQGAKPGHGGILPGAKVTAEVAAIRGVEIGKDVLSPPGHNAFSTPVEMMHFIAKLRDLSGGKPVGFKLCLGKRREFLAICEAMLKTNILPDFITVDGSEGGTGAAPLEFSNNLGTPLTEGLMFVHNALVGYDLRKDIRVIASGKVTSAFHAIKAGCIGADMVNSARGFMLALGCIQALRCNSNDCPTGIATQDQRFASGIYIPEKRKRVHRFHEETLEAIAHMIGAMGVNHTSELRPWNLMRRISPTESKHYGDIHRFLEPGELLGDQIPEQYARAKMAASADSFHHSGAV